jgi:hypothetical protein
LIGTIISCARNYG